MKVTLTTIVAALVLTACGSGSSSNPPPDRPIGKVSGVAYDGLILDGAITVYAFDGKKGASLATGRTDMQGNYSLSIQAASQPILIEVTGGHYVEEASEIPIPLLPGQHLLAVANYVSGQPINSSVTYWTTLAAGLAGYKITVGSPADKAVTQANDEITATLGLDIISITPRDPTDANNKSATLTQALEYGFAEAALSKWSALASTINKSPVHSTYTSIAFAQLAYDDIKYDGLLDGKGTAGALKFGSIALNQTVYRHDIATALLNMAADTRNVSGLTPDKMLATALRLNDSTVAMYGTASVDPIDGTGPVFSSVSPADNSPVHGTFFCSAVITDIVGLIDVECLIDGKLVGKAADVTAPSIAIDTIALATADGSHILSVRATNLIGTSTTNTSHIIVSNKGTTISNVSPVDGTFVRGSVKATVDVADPNGVKSVEVFLDGKSRGLAPDVTAPSLDIDTTPLGEGSHFLKIVATNTVGNSVESNTTFIVDNVLPVITATAPVENTYHAATFTASATVVDNNTKDVEFLVDGDSWGLAASKNNATKLVDTTKYKDGPHKLGVVASDTAGNTGTKIIPLIFDNTPPAITAVAPSPGAVFGSAVFSFSAMITDLSLATVDLAIDGNHYGAGGSADNRSVPVDSATLTEGAHALSIIATDQTGHVSKASTSVTIDHTPPTSTKTTIISVGTTIVERRNSGPHPIRYNNLCTVNGITSDTLSGVKEVTVDGKIIAGGGPVANWSYVFDSLPILGSNISAMPFCPTAYITGAIISETDNAGNTHTTKVDWCATVYQAEISCFLH